MPLLYLLLPGRKLETKYGKQKRREFFHVLALKVFMQLTDIIDSTSIRGTVLAILQLNKYYVSKEQKTIWCLDG